MAAEITAFYEKWEPRGFRLRQSQGEWRVHFDNRVLPIHRADLDEFKADLKALQEQAG